MHEFPVVKRLGLWALDDANDSNPFCYIGQGPCARAIIHFSHDDSPKIYYSSLNGCLESMATIASIEGDILDAVPEMNLEFPCAAEIARLCDDTSDDATFLICVYLPICSDLEPVVLEKLTSHPDFFVREGVRRAIAHAPSPRGSSVRPAACRGQASPGCDARKGSSIRDQPIEPRTVNRAGSI